MMPRILIPIALLIVGMILIPIDDPVITFAGFILAVVAILTIILHVIGWCMKHEYIK